MGYSILMILILLPAFPVWGQVSKETAKALENDLYKKTPYVRSARLQNCRLTLSVDVANSTGFNPLVGTMPGAMPTEGEMNTSIITGSGSRNLIRFDLDLAEFDTSGVVVATTKRKEHSVLMLTGRSKNAVLRTWNGKKDRSNSLDLTVYSKHDAAVAASMRAAITACTK
jgi:hypothetical protein